MRSQCLSSIALTLKKSLITEYNSYEILSERADNWDNVCILNIGQDFAATPSE